MLRSTIGQVRYLNNKRKLTSVGDTDGDVLGEWLGNVLGIFDGVEDGDFSAIVVQFFVGKERNLNSLSQNQKTVLCFTV